MCNKGRVVRKDCTVYAGTQCRFCDLGTFMNQPNGLYNCFPCTSCDTGHGLFVKQNCTATTDTVCDVLNGYYCKDLTDSNGCSLTEKHSQCAAGQRIKEPGTSRSDTVCEDCQPGFFSKDGVSCTAWKVCSNTQIKVKGSSTSDVVCGRTSSQHYFVFLPFLLCSVAFASLVTAKKKKEGKRMTF
ncbi:tumor necrosis factor receptor superfamily member 5-like isoform X2 [Astatotilapia calliptera]|nr:tumor necrosis factor receptor superfamily member 5-like isoform X2 [Astatotilapia calliptera]